jgi:tetratricopeptide (TPR) repeat protein
MNALSACRLVSASCWMGLLTLVAGAAWAERPLLTPTLTGVRPEARTAIESARKEVADSKGKPVEARAEALGKLGMTYLSERLLDAAEPCFANAQELQPDQLRWSYFLAVVQQRKGDLAGAAQSLRVALRAREGNLPAALRLAGILVETKAYDEAEALYRAALPNPLGVAAAEAGLGRIALAKGDAKAAIPHLEAALKAQPQASGLRKTLAAAFAAAGDKARSQEQTAQAGDQDVVWPDPLLAQVELMVQAPAARASNDPKIEGLRKAAAANPNDIEALRSLAGALVQAGDLEGAQTQYEELLRRAPRDARGYLELGSVKADRRRDPQAGIPDLRKAIEIDPRLREGHQRLAHMLITSGKPADAVVHLRKSIEIDPSLTVARLQLTRTLVLLERFDEARQEISQLLQREPGNFEALLMRGRVLAGANQPAEARKDFERVAAAGSATPTQRGEAHFNLGLMAQASNDIENAAVEYRKSIELDPMNSASLANLAAIEAATGALPESVAHYRRLVERMPDNVEARYRLATLLVKVGDRPAALEHFEVLYASNPNAAELAVSSSLLLAGAGQGPKAVDRLNKTLAAQKEVPLKQRVLSGLAQVHGILGKKDEAIAAYRQALAMGDVPGLRLDMARAMARFDRMGDAITEYDRYLKARPKDEEAHFERAMALIMAGRYLEARDRLVAVTATSTNLTLTHLLARLYASAPDPKVRNGQRAVQIAGTLFEKQRNPIHGETLALAMAAAGRFPDAIVLQKRLLLEAEQTKFDPRFIARVKTNLAHFEKNEIGVSEW